MPIITNLAIPYPDFKLQEVIDPEQFDFNNGAMLDKVNAVIAVLNQITDAVADGGSGADKISLTPIAPFTSNKLQAYLEEVIARLTSSTSGSSGAGFIGTPTVAGVTGITVSAQLASLKALLDVEKARITALETRATNVEGRATSLEGRATAVEGVNATQTTDITGLKTRVTNVENRATALESGKADKAVTYTKTEVDTAHNAQQLELNQKGALLTSIQNQIDALNNTYSTDAERVSAIQAVIASYELADDDLATLILNKADKNTVYTKTEIDGMTLGSYAVANFRDNVTIGVVTNEVQINIPEFVAEQDAIDVYVGGTYQTIDVEVGIALVGGMYYAQNLQGTWDIGTVFDFVVTKNTKVLNPSDKVNAGLVLLDGTLPKSSFNPALLAEFDGLKSSVSDGKNSIETAIESKGGTVADTTNPPSFAELVTGVNSIPQAQGNAVVGDVLASKTFTSAVTGASVQTGTMPNNGGASTITPGTTNIVKPAGYYSGAQTILGDADLIPANILSGKDIFGVVGTLISGKPIAEGSWTSAGNAAHQHRGLAFTPMLVYIYTDDGTNYAQQMLITNTAYSSLQNLGTGGQDVNAFGIFMSGSNTVNAIQQSTVTNNYKIVPNGFDFTGNLGTGTKTFYFVAIGA